MKRLAWFWCMVFLGFQAGSGVCSACGSIDTGLRITLPCVEVAGQRYTVVLDSYSNPLDAAWFYWRFSSIAGNADPCHCATVGPGLQIAGACVMFGQKQYALTLDFYSNPQDPGGLYWRLGSIQEMPVTLAGVTGPLFECYDLDIYTTMAQCIMNCGMDPQCIAGCGGGAFTLALQVNNPTGSPVVYALPSGLMFNPAEGGVQPMMLLGVCLTVPPGLSTQCVPAYCLDVSLAAPSLEDSFTTAGQVTQPCLLEIVALTQGKDLDAQDRWRIQDIVWECTENGTISAEDRAFLENL